LIVITFLTAAVGLVARFMAAAVAVGELRLMKAKKILLEGGVQLSSPLNYSLFSRRERVADSIRASVA
jgi:hypothetical protein